MPSASSWIAVETMSATARSCPRCTTSTPEACRMRRMMLIDASCPSNRLAAVTNLSGVAATVDATVDATAGAMSAAGVDMRGIRSGSLSQSTRSVSPPALAA